MVRKPIWISGIQENSLPYSKNFPKRQENKFLKVINAGYWLANTNGKISQLVYIFELNNKKIFSQSKVYTRSSFTNPANINKPFVYTGTLSNTVGSTKIAHSTVRNVKLNAQYEMIFEVYSDSNRTKLITEIKQKIISPVDNTSGCVKFSNEYMHEIFGNILDPNGRLIPVEKLIIDCVR